MAFRAHVFYVAILERSNCVDDTDMYRVSLGGHRTLHPPVPGVFDMVLLLGRLPVSRLWSIAPRDALLSKAFQ
jgi:hypothetical protein